MVTAANHAVEHHPHWKKEFARLEPHLGRSKAIVAIARKLLVAVWHVLSQEVADRFAEPGNVAVRFYRYAYKVGVQNLPERTVCPDFHPHSVGSTWHWNRFAGDPLGLKALQTSALKTSPKKE